MRFQVPFLGPESQLKSGFAVRASSVPTLYMLVPHCNFLFGGPFAESQLGNQASHVRASMKLWRPDGQLSNSIYAGCLNKRSCNFLFVARVGLCCGFCDFAVSFLVPPDGPKNGTVKVLFFCSSTKLCMWSQKWDRQAVPFLGPCLGSFFKVFCIRVAEAQCFGFNETLWLMATGRATREALLSEAGFEKVFRTQNWVR